VAAIASRVARFLRSRRPSVTSPGIEYNTTAALELQSL
jgi:hypothetical protein